jgi:hypothetical protein
MLRVLRVLPSRRPARASRRRRPRLPPLLRRLVLQTYPRAAPRASATSMRLRNAYVSKSGRLSHGFRSATGRNQDRRTSSPISPPPSAFGIWRGARPFPAPRPAPAPARSQGRPSRLWAPLGDFLASGDRASASHQSLMRKFYRRSSQIVLKNRNEGSSLRVRVRQRAAIELRSSRDLDRACRSERSRRRDGADRRTGRAHGGPRFRHLADEGLGRSKP